MMVCLQGSVHESWLGLKSFLCQMGYKLYECALKGFLIKQWCEPRGPGCIWMNSLVDPGANLNRGSCWPTFQCPWGTHKTNNRIHIAVLLYFILHRAAEFQYTVEMLLGLRSVGDGSLMTVHSNNIKQVLSHKYLGVHIWCWSELTDTGSHRMCQNTSAPPFTEQTLAVWTLQEHHANILQSNYRVQSKVRHRELVGNLKVK